MDFLALFLALRLLHLPCSFRRLLAGAGTGAAFGVLSLLLPGKRAVTGGLFLMTAVLSVWISLPDKTLHTLRILRVLLLVLVLEGMIGGILTAIWYRMRAIFLRYGMTAESTGYRRGTFLLIPCGITVLMLAFALFRRYRGWGSEDGEQYFISVRYHRKTQCFPCFPDTGNLAREPISGLPVIFLPETAAPLLSLPAEHLKQGTVPKSRLIPVSTVGGSSYCWGILPDDLTLHCGGCTDKRNTREIHAYLAFYADASAHSDAISAVIPSMLIYQSRV